MAAITLMVPLSLYFIKTLQHVRGNGTLFSALVETQSAAAHDGSFDEFFNVPGRVYWSISGDLEGAKRIHKIQMPEGNPSFVQGVHSLISTFANFKLCFSNRNTLYIFASANPRFNSILSDNKFTYLF